MPEPAADGAHVRPTPGARAAARVRAAWRQAGPTTRLAGVAGVLMISFSLVGFGTSSVLTGAAQRHRALAQAEATVAMVVLSVVVVVGMLATVWMIGPLRKGKARPGAISGLGYAALLALVTVIAWLLHAHHGKKPTSQPPHLPLPQPGQAQRSQPVSKDVALTGILIALVLALASLVAIVWWSRRDATQPPDEPPPDPDMSGILADAAGAALIDLDAEPDPRRAVIAAYARMESVLASYGVARPPYETPLEYLSRVLREFGAGAAAVDRLTGLFEVAKFSTHEVTQADRAAALAALREVRDTRPAAPVGVA